MSRKNLYLGAAALAAGVIAYFCAKAHAEAADATPSAASGTVTGGDPVILSGTFGYALPAAIPTIRQ